MATFEEVKDKSSSLFSLNEIANLYLEQGDMDKAFQYNYKALKLVEEITKEDPESNDINIANSFGGLAACYLKQKNYTKAKEFSDKALDMKKKYPELVQNIGAENLAFEIDSASGNFKDALEHYKQSTILREKYKSQEVTKAAIQEKFQNEYDKKKAIDTKEQEKKDALAKAESKKQKLIILFVGLGLLIVLVFAGFVFRSLRIRNKQNKIITEQKEIVEEKQREILDSIEYALRIQTAILPPTRIVKQYLENSFILYKPKDIVAGDFYWMETVQLDDVLISQYADEGSTRAKQSANQHINNQLILFAACDCTGHGVPGAMVSVVCHNALNRAVREFGLTQPAAILDKTAEIVIENFSKSEEDIKDGMDISLCSYNTQTKELQWAGANNPLWIVRGTPPPSFKEGAGGWSLEETKADKQPIGMNEGSKPFTNHTFTLNTGDTIYLFTDGFADQFGGDTGEKKLTRKRFKEVLLSIQNKPLQEQCIELDNFIVDYRKQVEQIDDILVMGVKV